MEQVNKRRIQEDQYSLPYHYSDIFCEEQKLLWKIERRALLRLVKGLLEPFAGQAILDAGCGDGRLCYELKDLKVRVTGVDQSLAALSFARAFNPNINFQMDNLATMDLKEKFDAIILMETIEHIPTAKILKVFQNLQRHLKPGGMLLITTPSKNLPLQPKHYQHFSSKELESILCPLFSKVTVSGYMKDNWQMTVFKLLRNLLFLLYPLRVRIQPVRALYRFLPEFYRRYLAKGDPNDCFGLIAVCRA